MVLAPCRSAEVTTTHTSLHGQVRKQRGTEHRVPEWRKSSDAAAAWTTLQWDPLQEKPDTKGHKLHDSIVRNVQSRHVHRHRKWVVGAGGWREEWPRVVSL